MNFHRASGILVHPTSLPGPHGSGDLGPAAYHFVDWLVSAGQRLWQILPLGGIGPGNSPYMSSSAFAGNVLLIDLQALQQAGWLDDSALVPAQGFADARLHFDVVVPWRMERLQRAAAGFAAGATAADRKDFHDFCAQHASWLGDYALFMALADAHGWRLWCDWSPALARRDSDALAQARARHARAITFWQFCQWCFFRQWGRLREYARGRGIRIVGDTPIFVAYQSADVWVRPELFELDHDGRPQVVAGVPPDYFSATGQRWGNPLYRWDAHAAEGYAWWLQRLRHTLALVDIVRIDHFRGFADYWEIPADQPTAVHGRWRPGPGMALFDAIAQALGPLPLIAEDLGVLSQSVKDLLAASGFPGMAILQFAFAGDARDPFLPHNHHQHSVVYTGTHDNDTTTGWWATASDHERHHARAYLATDGHDIAWAMMRAACASVADTVVHPMQDVLVLPSEHRMNLPGSASGWWAWRFEWSQVHSWHGQRLLDMTRLFGRLPAGT